MLELLVVYLVERQFVAAELVLPAQAAQMQEVGRDWELEDLKVVAVSSGTDCWRKRCWPSVFVPEVEQRPLMLWHLLDFLAEAHLRYRYNGHSPQPFVSGVWDSAGLHPVSFALASVSCLLWLVQHQDLVLDILRQLLRPVFLLDLVVSFPFLAAYQAEDLQFRRSRLIRCLKGTSAYFAHLLSLELVTRFLAARLHTTVLTHSHACTRPLDARWAIPCARIA